MDVEGTVRRIVVVDVEGSCLPDRGRSYPLEIAVGVPETGEVRSWLIRPTREWAGWTWDPDSQAVHGIEMAQLLARGRARDDVAREVREFIGDREIVSDNPPAEGYWMALLYDKERPIQVASLMLLYAAIAGLGERGRTIAGAAQQYALQVAPPTHRAGDDVRHHLTMLKELMRLAVGR